MTPESGEARAMNFFTGQVVRPVKLLKVDGRTSFIDPEGAQHTQVLDLGLSVSRGEAEDYVGKIQINTDFAIFDCDGCARDVDFSERVESVSPRASVWKKAPIYPDGDGWSSRIGSAVDMGDGTLLFIGGRFAFRVDQRDFAPVGSAPNLHVVDEERIREVIETAENNRIDVTDAYLAKQLALRNNGE
ncbi:hypothetical protein [Luteibacter sp. 3190]|uniref:hypothetical protein n=1 Tax=Luteibacter sp. 3190 TaxID=2817736 RepID=UPI002864FF81|nr:hypothetical protein [Luteibacter sp. 3190]MDR6938206.1 hypothetical protein [Luteibacter sp. 3190]